MIQEGDVVGQYRSRDLPWANKSRMGAWGFCEGSFLLQEMFDQKPKPIAQEVEESTVMGTNTHVVIALTTKMIKDKGLIDTFMKIPLEHEPKNSNLYFAFYSLCEEVMPPEARVVPEFCVFISNYCEWLVQCWLTVAKMFGGQKWAYEKYWLPIRSEVYIEIEEDQYFGTLDAVFHNPNHAVDKIPYIIVEFKTKEASNRVREYKGQDAFSAKLPTSKMQELHFEAYLAANGKIPKMVRTCTSPNPNLKPCNGVVVKGKCEACGHEYTEEEKNQLPLEKRMRKAFPLAHSYKDFLAAIVFLGGHYPFSAPKRMNARTMENVHRDVGILRQKWADFNDPEHENYQNEDVFEWKMSDYVCPHCMRGAECSERKMRRLMEATKQP